MQTPDIELIFIAKIVLQWYPSRQVIFWIAMFHY